jgi:hypothetical protein
MYFLGDYMMIAGKLLHSNEHERIVVDAYRVQYLKSDSSWAFEVVDISQHVYHFTSS